MKEIDLIVVDVGNSQCKVGPCRAEQLVEVHSFSLEETAHQPWRHREVSSLLGKKSRWVVSGSNPPIMTRFAEWLQKHKQLVRVIDASVQLPLKIDVQFPEKVGRDRLLNALAVETRPAIIISAGSAVTVDAVNSSGTFLGGAIFPGLRLMTKALNDYTAKLPLIDARSAPVMLPGKNTEQAMHAGIVHAVVGGIVRCVEEMLPLSKSKATIYLTGGDAGSLQPRLPWKVDVAPTLALQGIIIAARTL